MKVIAIGGAPGSGKSTLVKRIMAERQVDQTNFTEVQLVPYHYNKNLMVLGRYDGEGYAQGTDRMSMAVQPKAIDFLNTLKLHNRTLIFEGDRLFNSSFLEYCVENHDTTILVLKTTKAVQASRFIERGSEQNETWLRGRESKVNNIIGNMVLMPYTYIMNNDTVDDQNKVLKFIEERLGT